MGMKRGVLFAVAVSLIARYGASAFSMSPLVKPHALASSGSLERSRFCGGTREIKRGMATVTRVFRSPSLVLPEQVASVSSLVFNASWPVMACAIAQLSSTHRFLCLMASKIANGNGPAFDMVRDTWAGVEPNLHGALNSISVFSRPKSIASRHSEVATSPAVPTPAMTVGHRRARVKSKRKKQQQWMKGLADRSSSVACAVYFQNLLEDEQCIDMNAEPCKS